MRMKVFYEMRLWDELKVPARFNKNRTRAINPDNPARSRRISIYFRGREFNDSVTINPENKYPD